MKWNGMEFVLRSVRCWTVISEVLCNGRDVEGRQYLKCLMKGSLGRNVGRDGDGEFTAGRLW